MIIVGDAIRAVLEEDRSMSSLWVIEAQSARLFELIRSGASVYTNDSCKHYSTCERDIVSI